MKTILCYGDSNTYGYNPRNGMRYPENIRWTGILPGFLGGGYRVISEGCNGRTTVFDEPGQEWKNGRTYLRPCLNSHKPLDLVILMLGSNDLKNMYHAEAATIAAGAEQLVQIIQHFMQEKQGYVPKILLVSPPIIGDGITESVFNVSFDRTAIDRSRQFCRYYRNVAERYGCLFLDAAAVVQSSPVDSLHLEPEAHRALAEAFAEIIRRELPSDEDESLSKAASIGANDKISEAELTGAAEKNSSAYDQLRRIIARLRDPESGCPWDKRQTHESLKPCVVEEAAEVLGGIDILSATGNSDNLREELGDLLMQVVLHSQIAEEEGLFDLDDVCREISAKMIRRHPHVFHPGDPKNGDLEELIRTHQALDENGQPLTSWDDIKKQEKEGKEWTESYLPGAFNQSEEMIQVARERKKKKQQG